jgi:hypothetical protein
VVDALAVAAAAKQNARKLLDPHEWFVKPQSIAIPGDGPDQQSIF